MFTKVTPEMLDRELTVRILGLDGEHRDYAVSAHLCDENREIDGVECEI